MHALKRRFTAFAAVAFLAGTLSVIPGSAQTELDPGGCDWKTRWKDAHGKCTGCCDATQYSCPCTT